MALPAMKTVLWIMVVSVLQSSSSFAEDRSQLPNDIPILVGDGLCFLDINFTTMALPHFEKAYNLASEKALPYEKAKSQFLMGRASTFDPLAQKAHYLLALEDFRKLEKQRDVAEVLLALGALEREYVGNLEQSVNYLNEAKRLFQDQHANEKAAEAAVELAQTYFDLSAYQLAVKELNATKNVTFSNRVDEGEFFYRVGILNQKMGRNSAMRESLLLAIPGLEATPDLVQIEQEEKKAMDTWESILKQMGEESLGLGNDEVFAKRLQTLVQGYDDTFAKKYGELWAEERIGSVEFSEDLQKWMKRIAKVAHIVEKIDQVSQAVERSGALRKRLPFGRKTKILKKLFNHGQKKKNDLQVLLGLFETNITLDRDQALGKGFWKQLILPWAIYRTTTEFSEDQIFGQIDHYEWSYGLRAIKVFKLRDRDIFERLANAHSHIARSFTDPELALVHHQKAWSWFEKSKKARGYFINLNEHDLLLAPKLRMPLPDGPSWIGDFLLVQGRAEEALLAYDDPLFDKGDNPEKKLKVAQGKARAYLQLGQVSRACEFYREAVFHLEVLQASIFSSSLVQSFQDRWASLYSETIATLIKAGFEKEAFSYSERARARALLLMIGNRNLLDKETQATFAKAHLIKNELTKLKKRKEKKSFFSLSASPISKITEKRIRSKENKLQQRIEQLPFEHRQLLATEGLSTVEVSALLAESTSLVAYFILENTLLAWVINREGTLLIQTQVAKSELNDLIDLFRKQIQNRKFNQQTGAKLYNLLWRGLPQEALGERIIILPHGKLHNLPFASLWNSRKQIFLVQEKTLSNIPSAALLKYWSNEPLLTPTQPMILGNPKTNNPALADLPFAEVEAHNIAEIYGIRAVLGQNARESLVHHPDQGINIIHLAAHGVLDQDSLNSYIALAPDNSSEPTETPNHEELIPDGGLLRVREIFPLNMKNVALVVLSACETSLGELSRGDELVALNRAFIQAGSRSVVATLWSVDDRQSANLIKAFYTYLKRDPSSVAVALRKAQLDFIGQATSSEKRTAANRGVARTSRKENSLQEPYFWAGFTINTISP